MLNYEMNFTGKTVVITGASSGMGALSCRRFAEAGANVVMLDINEEALRSMEAELAPYGAIGLLCDVRKYSDIENAVNTAKERFGSVDITISYAGGYPARMLGDKGRRFNKIAIETLDWGVEVNFRAPMYMVRAVYDMMEAQGGGVIINIGSIDGVTGSYLGADYSAEKAGLEGLTKSIASMGAEHGVRCCMVSPGPVLTRASMANMATPMGRAAEPIEIVNLVMYLASDKAAFISGQNYVIDGARACTANRFSYPKKD